jgi:hypothetical protein
MARIRFSHREQFIEFAIASSTDDCIKWPFAVRKSSGYGAHNVSQEGKKSNIDAHRYVCIKVHGLPKERQESRHLCGNTLCINPKHLSWGTHFENMRDAKQHGTLKGGGRYRQRVFPQDRAAIQASKKSLLTLAQHYGMTVSDIGKIKRAPMQYDL